jgi:hypothetical protein
MGQDMMELEMSWPDLKKKAAPLYSSSTDEWAKVFRADGERLDNAIAVKNLAMAKRHFQYYRRRAGERFHRVDVDLKRLCDEDLLASVMGMIE